MTGAVLLSTRRLRNDPMLDHEGRASCGLGCLIAVMVALALATALGAQLGWLTLDVVTRVEPAQTAGS